MQFSVLSSYAGVLMDKNNTVRQAGGFILQLMPFAEEAVIAQLEENLKNLPSVTTMLDRGETPESMLDIVLNGLEHEILDKIPTKFECDCSKEKVEKAFRCQSDVDESCSR